MIRDPESWEKLNNRELQQQYEIIKKHFMIVQQVNRSMVISMWKALNTIKSIIAKRQLTFCEVVE